MSWRKLAPLFLFPLIIGAGPENTDPESPNDLYVPDGIVKVICQPVTTDITGAPEDSVTHVFGFCWRQEGNDSSATVCLDFQTWPPDTFPTAGAINYLPAKPDTYYLAYAYAVDQAGNYSKKSICSKRIHVHADPDLLTDPGDSTTTGIPVIVIPAQPDTTQSPSNKSGTRC